MYKSGKFGFTLAEILITLGIIGVVAAMTIPTLIANINGNRYRAQFKKSISTISQAARMNKANYGWDFADVNRPCSDTDYQTHTSDNIMSVCAIFNSNLSSKNGFYRESVLKNRYNYEFKGDTVGVTKDSGGGNYTVYMMSDGSMVGFRSYSFSGGCTLPIGSTLNEKINSMQNCTGFIDVNGVSLPNEEVKCSTGTTSTNFNAHCIVKTKDIKDVYPVVFHDSIVEPMTNASRYVFQTAK